MKKAIVGLGAVTAGVGLFLAARRLSQEMREQARQMRAHCKEMASKNGGVPPSEREVEESDKTGAPVAPTA